jgi:hypothetical protein
MDVQCPGGYDFDRGVLSAGNFDGFTPDGAGIPDYMSTGRRSGVLRLRGHQ